MRTVLVTIDTPRDSLDLELPAEMPLRELLPALLAACGLPATGDTWSLGLAESGPLPSARSLLECDIVDGMRLLLQGAPAWRARSARAPARALTAKTGSKTSGIGVRWRRDGLLPGA